MQALCTKISTRCNGQISKLNVRAIFMSYFITKEKLKHFLLRYLYKFLEIEIFALKERFYLVTDVSRCAVLRSVLL